MHEERCAGGAEQLLVTIHGQHAHSARDAPHAQRPPIAGVDERALHSKMAQLAPLSTSSLRFSGAELWYEIPYGQ